MHHSTVIGYLDDGPRGGEAIPTHAGPDSAAPHEVMVSDPRGAGERAEETVEIGHPLQNSTSYQLDQPASAANAYIHRVAGVR